MRRLLLFFVVSATTLLAVLGVCGAANAYTQTDSAGSYGRVGVPTAVANADNFTITSRPRWIGESPAYANSSQHVCITHRLWQFLPGQSPSVYPRWQVIQQQTHCGWIGPNQDRISDGGVVFSRLSVYDFYTPDLVVTWRSSTGELLGKTRINYVNSGDYSLVGPTRIVDRGGLAVVMFDF